MHVKILTPVTLTLTSESAFRFQNLHLGFKNSLLLPYQLRYTFNIWHTHALGQDLSMYVKIFTPVTLTLTSESAFRFRKLVITPIPIEEYLAHTCLGIRPFHACQNFDPCDLDLDLRVCVSVSKSAFRFRKLIISPIPIEVYLKYLAHTCLGTTPFHAC